ncbi:hypothetical protein FRB90_000356, partial [Tulasnella sp. 427]
MSVQFAALESELPDPYDEGASSGKFNRFFKDPVWDLIEFHPLVCQIIDTPQFQRLRYLKQLGTSCPFSHVFDNHFIPEARGKRADGTYWCHEEGSEMMLNALVKENDIDLRQDCVNFIKDLIRGEPRLSSGEKKFLFQIVANKKNGIDVDKWDYIARDTRAVGETCTLVASRLIHAARVIDDSICYDWKDAQSVYELFYSRYSLHKRVYSHKTAKAVEYMMVDALLAAEPVFHFSEAIDDPKKYLHLTDSIIEDIERRDDPRLAKSKQIIRDIRIRRVPK